MGTVLERSFEKGAELRNDATNDHLSREIWNNVFTSSTGGKGSHSDRSEGTDSDKSTQAQDDHVITFSDIFSEIKNTVNQVISIITNGGEQPLANTGIEKGNILPLDNVGKTGAYLDSSGKPSVLLYADGSTRHFNYNDKNLTSFTDRTGDKYTRNANGDWNGPDGKPANISNVNAMPDGTFSYKETRTGNVIVCQLDGSYKTVTPDQFGDLKLYPDSKDRAAENTKLQQLADKPGFLNPDGQKLLGELNKLGVDDVDALYGSHIVFGGDGTSGGDGGALYRQLINEYPVQERNSSHYPGTDTKQYQIITGPGNSAVLFGLTPDGNTFVQFEKDAAGTSGHTSDYNLYRALDQNVGPLAT